MHRSEHLLAGLHDGRMTFSTVSSRRLLRPQWGSLPLTDEALVRRMAMAKDGDDVLGSMPMLGAVEREDVNRQLSMLW